MWVFECMPFDISIFYHCLPQPTMNRPNQQSAFLAIMVAGAIDKEPHHTTGHYF